MFFLNKRSNFKKKSHELSYRSNNYICLYETFQNNRLIKYYRREILWRKHDDYSEINMKDVISRSNMNIIRGEI